MCLAAENSALGLVIGFPELVGEIAAIRQPHKPTIAPVLVDPVAGRIAILLKEAGVTASLHVFFLCAF